MSYGLYFGIDFGTLNLNVAFVRNDPRESDTKRVIVENTKFATEEGKLGNRDRAQVLDTTRPRQVFKL